VITASFFLKYENKCFELVPGEVEELFNFCVKFIEKKYDSMYDWCPVIADDLYKVYYEVINRISERLNRLKQY